jgi:hypothetical protein
MLRKAALAAITILIVTTSAVSFSESYHGLLLWANGHGLTGLATGSLQGGVTVARIPLRAGEGNEHERQTSEEVKALILLAWVTRHPRMQLVSFETS